MKWTNPSGEAGPGWEQSGVYAVKFTGERVDKPWAATFHDYLHLGNFATAQAARERCELHAERGS